jgi:deoxyribose-phosphate aldolase
MTREPPENIAKYIDHTLLSMTATAVDVERLCQEALRCGFVSVCVNPYFVADAKKHLAGSNVRVCSVIGFPLGASTKESKAFEARQAVAHGASEIDMVSNLCALKSGRLQDVEEDIMAVVASVPQAATVKVILETCYLTETEILGACKIALGRGPLC